MNEFYAIPSMPESLRPNWIESEISFIAPLPRKNYVINPSFEVDRIGETQPYNWSVGLYTYATNTLSTVTDIGSVVSENVYSGFKALRCNFGSDTSTHLVYGVTQPIALPLSAKKGAFYSTNQSKTLYRVNGALTFYAFAPNIEPYTTFSLFDQTIGDSRTFNVKVYATVDANGEPTANFSNQNIITSASVSISVTNSSFYSKEIEPNYIGRRKNPQWVRYVVPISTVFDYQKDNFLRFSISATNPVAGQSSNFIFYLDGVQVEFFDDDFPFYTTYLDGDLGSHDPLHPPGYYWEGANQQSISVRSIEAYSGGIMFNLQKDFMINVINIRGLGLPKPENQVTPFQYSDGQQYVSTGIDSRTISISGYVSGDTALESNRATGLLMYLLSKERSGVSNQRRFYYRIPEAICDGDGSEYVFFDAVVTSVKPDSESNNPRFNIVIELNNINIYYYTSNNVCYVQSALQPTVSFNNTYGIKLFKPQGAAAVSDVVIKQSLTNTSLSNSYFGCDDYELQVDGQVLCWCELNNGCILFGGQFTNVTYIINGVRTDVSCKNIAMLSPDGKIFPIRDKLKIAAPIQAYNTNGVSFFENNANDNGKSVVRAIIQTNYNTVMIGGLFNTAIGRTSECFNIWHISNIDEEGYVDGPNLDVEGGLVSIPANFTFPGTITITAGSVVVTGTNTRWTQEYVGANLYSSSNVFIGTVKTVSSKTSIILTQGTLASVTSVAYYFVLSNNGVYTLLSVPKNNAIYVGGQFNATLNPNTSTNTRRISAAGIYYFDRDYKWAEIYHGANSTVTTMTWFQERYVLIGGLFTAFYSSDPSGVKPFLSETAYAIVYDTAKSTADNQRIKSLSSVNVIAEKTAAEFSSLTNNSTFNAQVNKMITTHAGDVIIGGRFTYADLNSASLAAFQQLKANRIIKWSGYSRFTQMDVGIQENTMSYWGSSSGTIVTSTASSTVTGTNTMFSDADIGNKLYTITGSLIGTIASVASNTSVTLTTNALITLSPTSSYLILKYYIPNGTMPISLQVLEINDLCVSPYNDDVYAVGTFTNIGTIQQAFNIARWTTNRWEALDFELQCAAINSIFISKRGYGFIGYQKSDNYTVTTTNAKNPKTVQWNLNNSVEPNLIIIENIGLETQPVIELTNSSNNQKECDLISIYNLSNHKSMTFNMKIFVGETITIDFSELNIMPKSNIRDRISNSLVGGGTFSNFFLSEGVNIIKILGGQRGLNSGGFVRPLEVKIRYHARQISPYVVYSSDIIERNEPLQGWTLNKSKLGLDTVVLSPITSTSGFQLESTIWSKDSVVKT